jgi:excinuclease ABC subunit B
MQKAMRETDRRRAIQEAHNIEHGITPTTIVKEIQDVIRGKETQEMAAKLLKKKSRVSKTERDKLITSLEAEMHDAAKVLDFERAAELRDVILELKSES